MSADVASPSRALCSTKPRRRAGAGHGVDRAVDEGDVAATLADEMVEGEPDAGRGVGAHVVDVDVWRQRADDDDRLAGRR